MPRKRKKGRIKAILQRRNQDDLIAAQLEQIVGSRQRTAGGGFAQLAKKRRRR